jgi:hypothetical protein
MTSGVRKAESRSTTRQRSGGGGGLLNIIVVLLLVKAVRQQLKRPKAERTWHGAVPVEVPYDFRVPTLRRLRHRMWNPAEPDVVVPTVFGLGWTVNLARLLRRTKT